MKISVEIDVDKDRCSFSKATEENIPILQMIAKNVIKHNYESFLGSESVTAYINSGYSDKEIEDNIRNCIVLKLDEIIIGFGILCENRIHLIMIDVPYQHKSFGTKLLKHLESILFEKSQKITLQSFKGNVHTNQFYLKNDWNLVKIIRDENIEIEMVLFQKYLK